MTEKHDEFWDAIANSAAAYIGLSEPDLLQAQDELESAPDAPYSERQIQALIQRISQGQEYKPEIESSLAWLDDIHAERRTIMDMEAVLNRNKGAVDPKIQKKLNELRLRLLNEKKTDEKPTQKD